MVIMKSRLVLVSFIIVFRSSTDNAAFIASMEWREGELGGPFPLPTLGTSLPISSFDFGVLLLRHFGLVFWPRLAQNFGLSLWSSSPKSTNLDSWSNRLPFWPPDLACLFLRTQLPTPNLLPTCTLAHCFFSDTILCLWWFLWMWTLACLMEGDSVSFLSSSAGLLAQTLHCPTVA